jgi:hypothetical protein
MQYLAIGFWYDNQDFSISRETDSRDPIKVSDMLTKEAKMKNKDHLCAVLLVKNGPIKTSSTAPEVEKFWRGENGDFE